MNNENNIKSMKAEWDTKTVLQLQREYSKTELEGLAEELEAETGRNKSELIHNIHQRLEELNPTDPTPRLKRHRSEEEFEEVDELSKAEKSKKTTRFANLPVKNSISSSEEAIERRFNELTDAVIQIRSQLDSTQFKPLFQAASEVTANSATDKMWQGRTLVNAQYQGIYNDLLTFGRFLSKLEAGYSPTLEEVKKLRKNVQLMTTKIDVGDKYGVGVSQLIGESMEGTFMEPYVKDIKEARKLVMKGGANFQVSGRQRPFELGGSDGFLTTAFVQPSVIGSLSDVRLTPSVTLKPKTCFKCGDTSHLARDCKKPSYVKQGNGLKGPSRDSQ